MPQTGSLLELLTSENKALDKELQLLSLQTQVEIFCFNLEQKALYTSEPEKTVINKIIESEDYKKLKSNL